MQGRAMKRRGRPIRRGIRRRDPWRRKAARIASEFVEHYRGETGHSLDMALDRVRDLDLYLEKHFETDPLPKEVVRKAGYYFAEVWRRAFGGDYFWDEERNSLAIREGGLSVYPIEKVSRVVRRKVSGALETYAFVYARKRTKT